MAEAAHSITHRPAPAAIGGSPIHPIQVDVRPTSFNDALRQYREIKAQEIAITRTGGVISSEQWTDAAHDRTEAAFNGLLETPSPNIGALADKLRVIWGEYDGHPQPRHFRAVLDDAVRLSAA